MLDRLFWGDNVVWQLDGAGAGPFYEAIVQSAQRFESRTLVTIGDEPARLSSPGLQVLAAGPGTSLAHPADLLREVHRICGPGEHRLLLFASLDAMVRAWGPNAARGFFESTEAGPQ